MKKALWKDASFVLVVALCWFAAFSIISTHAQEPVEPPTTTELDNLALRVQLARSEVQRIAAQLDRDRLQRSVLESQLAILEDRIPRWEEALEQGQEIFQQAVDAFNAAQAQTPEAQEAIEEAGPPNIEITPQVPAAAK